MCDKDNPLFVELPDFETMAKMAKEDPEALEQLRKDLTQRIIDRASTEEQKRYLRGLNFKCEAITRKSKTPIASLLEMQSMMNESFEEMREALNNVYNRKFDRKPLKPVSDKGNIVSLNSKLTGDKTDE